MESCDGYLRGGKIYSQVIDLVVKVRDVGVRYLLVHYRLRVILSLERRRIIEFGKFVVLGVVHRSKRTKVPRLCGVKVTIHGVFRLLFELPLCPLVRDQRQSSLPEVIGIKC